MYESKTCAVCGLLTSDFYFRAGRAYCEEHKPSTEPRWLEGAFHDEQYEYVETGDCDGSYIVTFRRTPKRVIEYGAWEQIESLPAAIREGN